MAGLRPGDRRRGRAGRTGCQQRGSEAVRAGPAAWEHRGGWLPPQECRSHARFRERFSRRGAAKFSLEGGGAF